MNEIVKEVEKDELETHIKDGYKVIYPNQNVNIKLIRGDYINEDGYYIRTSYSYIKSGLNCWGINLYDRFIKNKNSLFLSPGNFSKRFSKNNN